MHIVSNAPSGPSVRALTRPTATLSQRARVKKAPLPLGRVMHIVSNAPSGPSVRALTRPTATLSQRARVKKAPLPLGEGLG